MIYKELLAQFNKIIFICSFFILCSCDQKIKENQLLNHGDSTKVVQKDSVVLNPNKGLVYYHNEPFTGVCITNYTNGQIAYSREYKKGKSDGLYEKWFSTSIKSFESTYQEGKLHGETRSWWKNGNLRTESNYIGGVAQGLQVQWYKSGTKFKHIQLVNGKEEGLQQSWRENGKLYNNYEAKNGRIFGLKRSTLCYKIDDEEVQY